MYTHDSVWRDENGYELNEGDKVVIDEFEGEIFIVKNRWFDSHYMLALEAEDGTQFDYHAHETIFYVE